MPGQDDKQNISSAIANLRAAEQCLDDVIANTGDPDVLDELNAEYHALNDTITALVQAQTITDDAIFARSSQSLTLQAAALKAQEDHIKQTIADVGIAAKILGYIAQAVTYMGAL
jgi:hypothetical protein